MKVHVRYFASIKEWTGLKEEDVEVPDTCTAEQLRRIIVIRHKKLEVEDTLLIAVNGTFVDHNKTLKESDDVALFPPVSGG